MTSIASGKTVDTSAVAWVAVATSSELKKKPIRVFYQGAPVVLFRCDNHIAALKDRCPHRGAPLSLGKVVKGTILCPYHGWQFDKSGMQQALPGSSDFIASDKKTIACFDVKEEAGLIWVKQQENAPIKMPPVPAIHASHSVLTLSAYINANIIDVCENFLDPLHTHFVHPGVIRSNQKKRHRCDVSITTVENGYQASYVEEKQQSGIMSKLFGRYILKSIGRIRYPGIIEVEYHSKKGIELSVIIYVNQETDNRCKLILRSYLRRRKIPPTILNAILLPFQYITFMQDKKILERIHEEKLTQHDFSPVITQYDVMRPYIEKALHNDIQNIALEKTLLL